MKRIPAAFVVLLIAGIVFSASVQANPAVDNPASVHDTASTSHAPIIIHSDSDFSSQGFPGNGSLANPYRIEDYDIYAEDGGSCITITDVTVYYRISDCILHGSTGTDESAIYIERNPLSSTAVISGCDIHNCTIGVEMYTDYLSYSSIYLQDTNISDFTYTGVFIHETSNVRLSNVRVVQDMVGLEAGWGVTIHNSRNTSMTECVFTNRTGAWGSSVSLLSSNSTDILDCSFYGCSHIHSSEDNLNITVSRCTFVDSQITVTSRYNRGKIAIANNTLRLYYTDWEWSTGIFVGCDESDALIQGNTVQGYRTGIALQDNSDTVFLNNITGCETGISVSGSRNTIRNNTCTVNQQGISMSPWSSNNSVFYNRFVGNAISACDDGANNTWDDQTGLGNYWDDFPPTHTGVYEVPGSLSGSEGGVDRWPVYIGDVIPSDTTTTGTSTSSTTADTPAPDNGLVLAVSIAGASVVFVTALVVLRKRR